MTGHLEPLTQLDLAGLLRKELLFISQRYPPKNFSVQWVKNGGEPTALPLKTVAAQGEAKFEMQVIFSLVTAERI